MNASDTDTAITTPEGDTPVGVSTLAPNVTEEQVTALVKDVAKDIRSSLSLAAKGEGAVKRMQERTCDLLAVIRIDGHVTFSVEKARKTETFRTLEESLWGSLFPEIPENVKGSAQKTMDQDADRKRLADAVKQMVRNGGVLEERVTLWALDQLPGERQSELGKPGALSWKGRPTGSALQLQDPPDDLTAIVEAQCERDGIKLWTTYGGSRAGGSGGGSRQSGQAATQADAVSLLTQTTESGSFGIDSASEALSDLAAAIARTVHAATHPKTGHEFPRAAVVENLTEACTMMSATVEYLDSPGSEHDRESFTAAVAATLDPDTVAKLSAMLGVEAIAS